MPKKNEAPQNAGKENQAAAKPKGTDVPNPEAMSLEMEDKLLKRTKPKKFIADGSDVFTQNVSTKLRSEIRKVDGAMQRLVYAAQKPTYLSVKVSGVRHSGKHGLCALCYYGNEADGEGTYPVLIPFENFTDITDEELELRRINRDIFLERRIGSVIDFIPEDFEKEDNSIIFIGNRVNAMKMSCYENWFATEKGSDSKLRFNVGSKIEARVVGKYPRAGIRVEIFGVEATIPLEELSYVFIPTDLSTIGCDVGDDIVVSITRLKRKLSPKMEVEFTASVKRTKPDPRLAAFDKIHVGDSMHGTISNILFRDDDITKSRIFISLDGGGEAMCARFEHEQIAIGDKVSVKIGNKYLTDDGQPRLECHVKHVFH